MKNAINTMKKRKGFSLVELVVVILIIAILAVAVFAGGSAAIKKSQVARTTSDLHNFSIAIESAMNETPSVANMKYTKNGATGDGFEKIVAAVKNNLPADYALKSTLPTGSTAAANLVLDQSAGDGTSATYTIYESEKKDAWGNPYYVIFDSTERHENGISEFYVTVVSAGPNAQTSLTTKDTSGDAFEDSASKIKGIESDDVFLLVQYSDGDVAAATYNCGDSNTKIVTNDAKTPLVKVEKGSVPTGTQGYYIGVTSDGDGHADQCPVNFQPTASSLT